ncbi:MULTISPECIES: helix-turn-helix domain-containing protein [Streptomyces]|uniref:Helix-turn-helix transcriptional regulator n=1 Tax=Streptomyces chengmaiensis TaxID=3040919 RepID=A0ABT6HRJ9_9ACTN|nr:MULTISPECIES: helix-turn-helix transcriptional regulator [Streptomyces]MDH2390985.1 helix-turn-helix transcriptional regulator [Streptomyces chengmaiensis]WRQ82403.1 helix-turn-helix transcriptional regulator [Streptomyces sp. MUM 178J]
MAVRKEIDGSASVPEFYGAELRYQREAAGLTLEKTVEGSFYGVSYLSEIERGERRMPEALARHVDQVLKTDGFFERRCGDVRKARKRGHADYFERILEAEKHADTIEEWAPTLFPGLLQTEAYARAVVRATHPLELDGETEAKVSARLARARLFEDDRSRPDYWVILHEGLLKLSILPPEQMAEQLNRVIDLAEQRRIYPQVLSWKTGAHPFMLGTAMIMTFVDAPPLVYTESLHSGSTIDDPGLVKDYRRSYDRLRAAALPPEASLALIESAAEDYRNGKQPG